MLKPVLFRVLVQPDEVETTTKAGIIIAVDPKKERLAVEKGVILAMGETAFQKDLRESDEPAKVKLPKVGDHVYYAKYAGKIVKDSDDKEYLMLQDEDIIAIIE